MNLAAVAAVLLRRLVKHWYHLARDEQRRAARDLLADVLDRLRQGQPAPARPPARLRPWVEEELVRRATEAEPDERARLLGLFRQWGFLAERRTRLRHASPWQRAYSALVLGRMQAREALADIVALLAENNADLRLAALRALELLGHPEGVGPLIRMLPAVKDTAWRLAWAALIACARSDPARLLRHLDHPEPRVRQVVAAVLGEVAPAPLILKLLERPADPDPDVRARRAWALGRSRSSAALEKLVEWGGDPVWYVRLQSAGALGALGDRRAHEPLCLAIRDANLLVRQKATASLYELWHDPLYLIDFLRQGGPDRYALEALVSELEWRGVTWEAIHRVNSPLPSLRDHSRELVTRLVAVGAYAPVLYAIEIHPDSTLRLALLELVAQALPPEGYLDLVQVLASPYLDTRTRRALEKLVGFPAEVAE